VGLNRGLTTMFIKEPRPLGAGYSAVINELDEKQWCEILKNFDDANIYQTWSYGEVTAGRGGMSHLALRRLGMVVAVAQARIVKVPMLQAGIAYVRWGPIWRRCHIASDGDIFRQSIRALRNEFVCRRGLTLRLFPLLFNHDDDAVFPSILREEGFSATSGHGTRRTVLFSLAASLEELREGMKPMWKRNLKLAERSELDVIEGTDQDLFDAFIQIYRQTVSRKRFVEPNDIYQYKKIQARLPADLKMRIILCKSGGQLYAGAICSVIGNRALYLFGATSDAGLKSQGSYLLQWRLIEQLRHEGVAVYDLNGVNPVTNPGTYKFKSDLAGRYGRDVSDLGRFDAQGSLLSDLCISGGTKVQDCWRLLRESVRGRVTTLRP